MKGRDPHLFGHRTNERGDALFHLASGLIREGDGEDFERRHTKVADEMSNALGEHTGLARTGASDDEQRAFGVGHGLVLDGIEALEEVGVRARRAVVEKGSHGAVTLPAPCDALSRLTPGEEGAPGRTPAPDQARLESGARAHQPNVQSPLNVRSLGCPMRCLQRNRSRYQ
ncbi:unannotated protein [freshwater metagenome]|uniref:Unannotated protein n=1 Tax=freshwater metagenome TaxID=449393 RepID=A0A6J6EYW6_9ZZZZ